MAGTNNFLVFDSTNANMMTDAAFTASSDRLNGVTTGQAGSAIFNKSQHQSSVMAAAIAQFIAAAGQNAQDADPSTLAAAFTAAINVTVDTAIPNITAGTSAPTGGSNGDIYIMYS
jgi:hypothetical protein